LKRFKPPVKPQDLLNHRLLAFSFWKPDYSWTFFKTDGAKQETVSFEPYIAMNDYAGLATALVAGTGIGELPPIVEPKLLRDGLLVEIMPAWRFTLFDLTLVRVGNRYTPRHVRVFNEFAAQMTPTLFPNLPK
jgi:DNA-binding transcriptional LysR family regulator